MDRPQLACVLRSGGDYKPEHVLALRRGVQAHLPDCDFYCLSDVTGMEIPECKVLPLMYRWPGWWSKLEVMRPGQFWGDILYLDLDTLIVGDLTDIASARDLTILRDFYRPDGLQSSLMSLPAWAREQAWARWMERPEQHMKEHGRRGDQAFLETLWLDMAQRWQDVLPGQVVSYKVHVAKSDRPKHRGNGTIPPDARLVCFHGKPRPWQIELP